MYVEMFDIIAITETWLNDSIASGLLDPESAYNTIRKCVCQKMLDCCTYRLWWWVCWSWINWFDL